MYHPCHHFYEGIGFPIETIGVVGTECHGCIPIMKRSLGSFFLPGVECFGLFCDQCPYLQNILRSLHFRIDDVFWWDVFVVTLNHLQHPHSFQSPSIHTCWEELCPTNFQWSCVRHDKEKHYLRQFGKTGIWEGFPQFRGYHRHSKNGINLHRFTK